MMRKRGGQIVVMSSLIQDVPWNNIGATAFRKADSRCSRSGWLSNLRLMGIRVQAGRAGVGRCRPHRHRRTFNHRRGDGRGAMLMCSVEASYVPGATQLMDGGRSLNIWK
jgi:hypothetical protein